jgi:UDP-glucose 4-epimerase
LRVLITGGAGFIGSHLAEAYLHNGDEVYIIDDLSTGSLDNIAHLKSIGFHPRTNLDAILTRVVNHMRRRPDGI